MGNTLYRQQALIETENIWRLAMRNLVAFVISTAITALIGPSLAVALTADAATPVSIEIAATATATLNADVVLDQAADAS